MLKAYPAIIHNEDNNFWIEFPDLEGCQTYADTLENVLNEAQEALGLYLVSLLEDNKELPKATYINDIKATNGFTSYIETDINKYRKNTKSIKKTLSIPEWLNNEAEKHNINFSKTLQEALKNQLGL